MAKRIGDTTIQRSNKVQKFRTTTALRTEPKDTGLSFQFEVPALDDIHSQDIILWKQILQNLVITGYAGSNISFTLSLDTPYHRFYGTP